MKAWAVEKKILNKWKQIESGLIDDTLIKGLALFKEQEIAVAYIQYKVESTFYDKKRWRVREVTIK